MASQVNNTAWLEWIASLMGDGSRQTQTAMLSPSRFHCLLDELPLHLIQQRQFEFGYHDFVDIPLFLNPQCSVLSAHEVPAELEAHRHLLENFDLRGTVA